MRIDVVWHFEQAGCDTDALGDVGLGYGTRRATGWPWREMVISVSAPLAICSISPDKWVLAGKCSALPQETLIYSVPGSTSSPRTE